MIEVAQEPRVGRRDGADGVLDGADRRDGVDRRADAADALREGPGVARVAALQDDLDAPEHRGRGPGVFDCPPSTSASMRRWPSMRVTGSTTTCVMADLLSAWILQLERGSLGGAAGWPLAPDHSDDAVGRKGRAHADRRTGAHVVEIRDERGGGMARHALQGGGRRGSSCPRSRARRSRCTGGRSQSASWCRRSSARSGSSGTSPGPLQPILYRQ